MGEGRGESSLTLPLPDYRHYVNQQVLTILLQSSPSICPDTVVVQAFISFLLKYRNSLLTALLVFSLNIPNPSHS